MSKVLLMRDLSEDMIAAIERCKDQYDLKTNTAAVELMVTNYFKVMEKMIQYERQYRNILHTLRTYRAHREAYNRAKSNYDMQEIELNAMIENEEERLDRKYAEI